MSKRSFCCTAIAALMLTVSLGAGAQSLYVTPSGDVGVGTDAPLSSLELTRSDGTAQILVNETNETAAPRTLFQLQNYGNTKFSVVNTEAGVEWSFTNAGSGFRLSRQGSGFVEFEVYNNGDANLEGSLTENSDVNAKQDIAAINVSEILAKVVTMPISEWRYKDAPNARHVGPMAQDFYAAFGLGSTDTGIATLDSTGVALAAIQGLNEKFIEQNRNLLDQNSALELRVHELEQQNQRIEELVARMVTHHAEQVAVN